MKVCNYCGCESGDSQTVCPSCGATDFSSKCPNCGKIFKGTYCPDCGVRASQKPRTCPKCGNEHFSKACPECGYIPLGREETEQSVYPVSYSPQKRKTWLWVLGWIFIFPVPLTIIVVRSNKLNKFLKIAIVAIVWTAYILMAQSGGTNSSESKSVDSHTTISETTGSEYENISHTQTQ